MKASEVKTHWEDRADEHGRSVHATTKTETAKRLEIDTLIRTLDASAIGQRGPSHALEVGCGNGLNCIALAEHFENVHFTGVDYVDKMVEMAEHNRLGSGAADRLDFHVGDVRELGATRSLRLHYDLVLSNRCLINLASADEQERTLAALAARVAEGGQLLLVENSQQSYARQNDCRERLGLPRRSPAPYNVFLDERRVLPQLESLFARVEVEDFSSLHDLVLYALLPATNGGRIEYDHPLVAAATDLSTALPPELRGVFGSFGQNRLFACSQPTGRSSP